MAAPKRRNRAGPYSPSRDPRFGLMLVLCDLDGTLLFPLDAVSIWATELAEEFHQGEQFVEWVVAEFASGAWERRTAFGDIRDRLGIRRPLAELGEEFTERYLAAFRCDDDVRESLTRLRNAGHHLAVITNGPPSQIIKLRSAGIVGMFDAVCISGVEGVAKPDPRIVARAAELARCDAAGGWVVGDSHADVGVAVAAQLSSVYLGVKDAWPTTHSTPTAFAENFAAATDLILGWPSPRQ